MSFNQERPAGAVARWSQFGPLSGAVFAALFLVGSLLIGAFKYMPPSGEVVPFYQDHSIRIAAGAYLVVLSAFFLLWFAGTLRGIGASEGDTAGLQAIASGGAVATAVLIVLSSVVTAAAAERARTPGGIGPEAASALYDLTSLLLGSGAGVAFAALIGPTAVVSLRHGVLPRWLAWAGAVLAVALLTPINYIFVALVIPWIAAVSILLYARGKPALPVG